MLGSFPLLEREPELRELAGLLDQAAAGRGALLLIGGEAGIGKTALLEAALQSAPDHLAVVGHCPGPGETPLYGPLLQAVHRLADRCQSDLSPLPPPYGSHGGTWTPYRLAGALSAWLGGLGRPVFLALEDLHWADSATLEVLRHLPAFLADRPVLVAATYRTAEIGRSHPLWAVLPQLQRQGASRLMLQRLSADAVARLAADVLGGKPDLGHLTDRLYRHTSGLPLFVRELLHSLAHTDDWTEAFRSETLQQVIDSLLARLGPHTREVLQAAAVIGEQFDWSVLQRITQTREEQLLGALDEAVSAQVIRPEGVQGQRFRFDHALIRDALVTRLIGPRRHRWHSHIAEALLLDPHGQEEAIAYHLSQAGDDRALEYLVLAGLKARNMGALAHSEAHFSQALDLAGPAHPRRGELLLLLAYVVDQSNQRLFLERVEAALMAADAVGDRATSWLARRALVTRRDPTRPLREVLARLEALESEEIDLRRGPDKARMDVLSDSHATPVLRAQRLALGGRTEETRALIERLRRSPLDPRNRDALEMAELLLAIQTGDFATAIDRLPEVAREYLNGRDPVYGLALCFLRLYVMSVARADHPDELDRWAEICMAHERTLLQRAGYSLLPAGYSLGGLYYLRRGDTDAARHHILGGLEASGGDRFGTMRTAAAELHLAEDRPIEALSALSLLTPLRPGMELTTFDHPTPFAVFGLRVEAHLRMGEPEMARAWVETAEAWLEQGDFRAARSTVRLARAKLSKFGGDMAGARAAALEAVACASKVRHLLDLIAGYRLLSEVEAALGFPVEALEHGSAGLDLAERCRFPDQVEQIRRMQSLAVAEQPNGTRSAAPALSVHLTERELAVVRLVAKGLSDKEVSARLGISPRTVDSHLRNVFSKLGITNRAALTAWAIRHGLAE